MSHKLKILPCYFKSVIDGDKRFEIRNDADRGFQKGDIVELEEYEPGIVKGRYTGNAVHAKITYVTGYNQPQNQVVFGFEVIEIFNK